MFPSRSAGEIPCVLIEEHRFAQGAHLVLHHHFLCRSIHRPACSKHGRWPDATAPITCYGHPRLSSRQAVASSGTPQLHWLLRTLHRDRPHGISRPSLIQALNNMALQQSRIVKNLPSVRTLTHDKTPSLSNLFLTVFLYSDNQTKPVVLRCEWQLRRSLLPSPCLPGFVCSSSGRHI